MTKARADGLLFLVLGSVMFVAAGYVCEHFLPTAMVDFRSVYYPSRCLVQQCDPYRQGDLQREFQTEQGDYTSAPEWTRRVAMLDVYPPTTLFLAVPFALLPWDIAHLLWMVLTAVSFILAAYLMWSAAAEDAPVISGILIGLFLIGNEILVEIGNPAGIAVSLCVIAVWCFVEERFVPAGVLCLALSLAAKPHVAGMIWLYFLLAGGHNRRRALQALAVVVIIGLPAILWVSHVAPHWMGELKANLQTASLHGNVNDPGPAGVIPEHHGAIMVSLQTVVSVFRDDPHFYNPVTYLLCAPLLFVWAIAVLRGGFSRERAWLALAAISALSMLPLYHRVHDTSLLLLAFPAFAMLWAKGGPASWLALLFTGAAAVMTSDLSMQQVASHSAKLRGSAIGLPGQLLTLLLARPIPLVLLGIGVFFLCMCVRYSSASTDPPSGADCLQALD